MIDIIMFINGCLLLYFILVGLGYTVILLASIRDVFLRFQEIKRGDVLSVMKSQSLPPVTALIAAYNEEKTILEAVSSVMNSDYPNTYLIVINDGSMDNTLSLLVDKFNLEKTPPIFPQLITKTGVIYGYYISKTHKNIVVIDKEHVDKSDSLNVGLNACRTPLFLTVDADTLLEPDAISETVFYMLTKPHAVAVGGATYILNGCQFKDGKITKANIPNRLVPALQVCEYLRSFVMNRAGWNKMGGALSLSGAFTLFEHKVVVDLGGFDVGNPACDVEMITHLHAHQLDSDTPYQIGFTPAATAWTEVPATLKEYWQQRAAWQSGALKSLMMYKKMFFNRKYGLIGFFSYPFFLLVETLGAFVELTAYINVFFTWYLGIISFNTVALLFIACWLFVTLLTSATALMSFITYNKYRQLRDFPWLILMVVIECFGFRQYQMTCHVVATIQYFVQWGQKKYSVLVKSPG